MKRFNQWALALAVFVGAGLAGQPAHAVNSASIVTGSLTQGTVKASLAGGSYAQETNDLSDWPLDTGGFSGTVFPISLSNANFNGNGFGGSPNTMIAFGNGGGVTLQLDQAIAPVVGQKEFGLFTAQMLLGGSGALFNGNMEAAVLVSANGADWVTLTGVTVTSPTGYVATSHKLNAPTMAYDYLTTAQAWAYGSPGTTQANLDALSVADFQTAMTDDNLFNGTGTDAQRLALASDASTSTYDAVFGDSGGGNWFDISDAGLAQVRYIRLNGVNVAGGGGIRLDAVFATQAATVPEPVGLALLGAGGVWVFLRRKRA